jgi:ABC-type transport system involved in multi-copper enzyme maturation permease subunit
LLTKDWRLFRVPTIALLIVTFGSYGLGLAGALYRESDFGEAHDAFFSASVLAANLVPLLAAAFGGVAIAGERSDRTADFLALLPVTRGQIVISKLVVSFLVLTAFSIFSAAVALVLLLTNPQLHRKREDFQMIRPELLADLFLWAACSVCLFGTAWLLSTWSKSGPISASISMAMTVATISLIAICLGSHPDNAWIIPFTIAVTVGILGVGALMGGTAYYLKRIAP